MGKRGNSVNLDFLLLFLKTSTIKETSILDIHQTIHMNKLNAKNPNPACGSSRNYDITPCVHAFKISPHEAAAAASTAKLSETFRTPKVRPGSLVIYVCVPGMAVAKTEFTRMTQARPPASFGYSLHTASYPAPSVTTTSSSASVPAITTYSNRSSTTTALPTHAVPTAAMSLPTSTSSNSSSTTTTTTTASPPKSLEESENKASQRLSTTAPPTAATSDESSSEEYDMVKEK